MHHTEERLYKCDTCEKTFFDASSLQKHMFTHLQKKPFVCNVCGKDFAQKGNLKKHQGIRHKFPKTK
jgi:KRAB domain-containing zinc finger protein